MHTVAEINQNLGTASRGLGFDDSFSSRSQAASAENERSARFLSGSEKSSASVVTDSRSALPLAVAAAVADLTASSSCFQADPSYVDAYAQLNQSNIDRATHGDEANATADGQQGQVADTELVEFLHTISNNTFAQNAAYVMQEFRIVDTTPQGGQERSAHFIVHFDCDQWMLNFGHRDETVPVVDSANTVSAATRTPLGIQVRQVSSASGASRPKSAVVPGLGKPYSLAQLGALQIPNKGDCPCALFLTAELKAEQDHCRAGESSTDPLAVYHRARTVCCPLIQQDVIMIRPTKSRMSFDKFIANLDLQ
jgi:hypothetical protein